jgi:hypothetical protein
MTPIRILQLAGAVVLAVVFWLSVRTVGRIVLRVGGWRTDDEASAEVALGLGGYSLCSAALGALGWLWWPVVAVIAVVPGVVGGLRWFALRRRHRIHDTRDREAVWQRLTWLGLAITVVVYAVLASAPAVHYDLMVNYLAVPKAYLVSGSIAPLPANVFSTLAFGLHSLIVFPLALSELVDFSVFLFGGAEVVGFANLGAMVIAGTAAVRLGSRVSGGASTAGRAALAAVLLWACMPQNLLVAALELPDPFVTCLAMVMTASLVAATAGGGAGDALACGAACGLLVAAKPQAAVPAVVVGLWWLLRLRRDRSAAAFFAGALVTWLPTAIRGWVWLGSPLYPVLGAGDRAESVGRLLSENTVDLPSGVAAFGARVVDLMTLYPEVGLVPVGLVGLLLVRPRAPVVLAVGLVPVVVLCLVSGSMHNVLRWLQAPVLLLLVLAGEGAAAVAQRVPVVRGVPLVLAAASLGIGVWWVDGTVGAWRGLRDPAATVRATVSAHDLRQQAAGWDSDRILWIGEVQGYWGARNGTFPTVRDGAYLGRILASPDPVQAMQAQGFTAVIRTRGREGILEEQGFWQDVGPNPVAARDAVEALLERLRVRERTRDGVVYELPASPQ